MQRRQGRFVCEMCYKLVVELCEHIHLKHLRKPMMAYPYCSQSWLLYSNTVARNHFSQEHGHLEHYKFDDFPLFVSAHGSLRLVC